MRTCVDYIIVGQGIAGSTLACQLLKRNKRIIVYDQPERNVSSSVGAGLFNPITGKNWVKTWKADTLFPYMKDFYQEAEQQLGVKCYFEKTIYRPFQSLPNQNDWMGKWATPGYTNYVQQTHTTPQDVNIVKNPYGGLEMTATGYVNIPGFLNAVQAMLRSKEMLRIEQFDSHAMQVTENKVTYGDVEARRVVFCQGPQVDNLWDFLPMKPVKGEIISIRTDTTLDKIYNMGAFVLPRVNGEIKVGSTYSHQFQDYSPTESAKNQILERVDRFFLPKFEVVGHVAGIRPATLDRRPFLGMHRKKQNIVIFNGLGAKGVTLAPYFSGVLADYLEGKGALEKEVNVERYYQ